MPRMLRLFTSPRVPGVNYSVIHVMVGRRAASALGSTSQSLHYKGFLPAYDVQLLMEETSMLTVEAACKGIVSAYTHFLLYCPCHTGNHALAPRGVTGTPLLKDIVCTNWRNL